MPIITCTMKREWVEGALTVSYGGNVSVKYGWEISCSSDAPYEPGYPTTVTLTVVNSIEGEIPECAIYRGETVGVSEGLLPSLFTLGVRRDPPVMGEAALTL